jgi:hypothetical protein
MKRTKKKSNYKHVPHREKPPQVKNIAVFMSWFDTPSDESSEKMLSMDRSK